MEDDSSHITRESQIRSGIIDDSEIVPAKYSKFERSKGSYLNGLFCLCYPGPIEFSPASSKSTPPSVSVVSFEPLCNTGGDVDLPLGVDSGVSTQTGFLPLSNVTISSEAIIETSQNVEENDVQEPQLQTEETGLLPRSNVATSSGTIVETSENAEENLPEPLLRPGETENPVNLATSLLAPNIPYFFQDDKDSKECGSSYPGPEWNAVTVTDSDTGLAKKESSRLSVSRSVEQVCEISKIGISEVRKILKLHVEKLDYLIEYEKLFQAKKYLDSLTKLIQYNNEYWSGFLKHLQTFRKSAGGSEVCYGAVGEVECTNILQVLDETAARICVSPIRSTIEASGEELSKYETLVIKVKMVLQNLSFFHLEHLKIGCLGGTHPSGSGRETPAASGTAQATTVSQNSPATFCGTTSQMEMPCRDTSDELYGVRIPSARDGAEAAVTGSPCMMTSNAVLVMLLRGDQQGSFVHEHLATMDSDCGVELEHEASLCIVECENEETSETRQPKQKYSGTLAPSSLRILSKKAGNNRGQKKTRHSGISKMGSKMLHSLMHHSSYKPRYRHRKVAPEDADSWTREKTKYLDLWYRIEKNNSISMKVRGKLPCALFEVLAILNETDLAGNWAPMFKSAKKEHQMTRASQLVRQVFDYPLIGQMESIMYCFGVDALVECGCVMIFCQCPPDTQLNYLGFPLPRKGKMSRVQSATLCFLLFPVSGGKQTTLELYSNFAHGLRFAPTKLVAYVVKKVTRGVFVSIAKQARMFDSSVYAKRVKDNPGFYNWIRDTISDFCGGGDEAHRAIDTASLASFDINDYD